MLLNKITNNAIQIPRWIEYREIGRAYLIVAVVYTVFFGAIKLDFAVGYTPIGPVIGGLLRLITMALLLFAAPLFVLAVPNSWWPAPGFPWPQVEQGMISAVLLVAVTWVARRQPTPRRRFIIAAILGAWVLALPLLIMIQAYTPIPIDELF